MNDTPAFIAAKQFEIIYAKTMKERILMTIEMMDFAIEQTRRLIQKRYPDASEAAQKLIFIRWYYPDAFSPEEMERIEAHFKKV